MKECILRKITYNEIVEKVAELCVQASCDLPQNVFSSLENGVKTEKSELGKAILDDCLKNAKFAKEHQIPICQDTGFAVFFIEIGKDVSIDGGSIYDAIDEGTATGYKKGFLRKSIVADPVFNRINTGNNTPSIIHLNLVPGDKISITMAPKGGGSENMSALKMMKPSDGKEGVVKFVVETVVNAGGNPCPPTIVGVGIGGTFEKVALLAKKALLRELGTSNPNKEYAELENDILSKINASGVGPQGLGGTTTALAVHIEYFPCHIASLPVAVNLNCHAARHAKCII